MRGGTVDAGSVAPVSVAPIPSQGYLRRTRRCSRCCWPQPSKWTWSSPFP